MSKHAFGVSKGVVLVKNKNTASVLLGGFLTQNEAGTSFQVTASEAGDKEEFDCFKAICSYDPPVCLSPGESLETEQLYITLATIDDYQVLERYGAAVAAVNNLKPVEYVYPLWYGC